jgi:hypothetical protein
MKKATISLVMSVRLPVRVEQLGSHWTDFHEIRYLSIFRKMSRKLKFHPNRKRITRTLHEDRYTVLITSHSVLPTMRNVSGKIVEKIKTHILRSVNFFFENPSVYEMWEKKNVEPDWPMTTI